MDDDAVSDRDGDGEAAKPVEATVDAVTDEVAGIVADTASEDDQDKAPALSGAPIDPGSRRLAIGVDVGGSGIKAALVDLDSGELVSPRHRVPTPQPSAPAAVIASISRIVRKIEHEVIFGSDVPCGVGFPAIVIGGVTKSAANVDPGWLDFDADRAMERVLHRPVHLVNDADAAGVAEMRFGAGVGRMGTVFLITLGTGTGSALFSNGLLVPNLELGHMEIRGRDAERRSAAAARVRRGPELEGLGRRPRRAPAGDRAAVLAPAVHHRRRRLEAGRSVHPAPHRPRRGHPGQPAQRRGDRRRGDGGRRGRADIDGRVTTDHARPMAVAVTRMVIGGQPADAADGRTFEVVEPHRGTVIATSPLGGSTDVDRAVEAAQAAFDGEWGSMAASDRGRLLLRFAQVVRDHEDELAALESRQIGKPISGARWEVGQVARVLEFYAGAATKLRGSTIPVTRPGLDLTLREPIGVVGLIVPWNFPVMMASWKVGPALAAGNTAILKPASYSPLTAIRLAEYALEAGLPPGVFNVVTGPGPSVGGAMAAHPGIGKIGFTGETATGQEILRVAAGTVKKVSLELGGKSPNIVFADADLEAFAAASPYAVFDNCGQDCCARSRILVERSVHERVVELFAAATERVKVGDPSDPATEVGPLVSFRQRERVEGYVDSALEEGATLVTGGVRPSDPALADGAYLLPAVFDGVAPSMRIAREEVFGPVVGVIPFDTDEEALRIANASPYGLSGSIWSRDIGRALRAAKALKSGVVSVNCNNSVHVEAPFGGYKQSGIGKDLGTEALEQYTELKNVFIDLG